jgi:tripartite-type tricarboxylate transporter receptor subunit TctC
MTRWIFVWACAASSLLLGFAPPASAEWPERPIRLVLPFPAGGPTDTLGRQLAQQLQTALGQSVVVDNRAGANSAIGSDIVAKSPADGYTLRRSNDMKIMQRGDGIEPGAFRFRTGRAKANQYSYPGNR